MTATITTDTAIRVQTDSIPATDGYALAATIYQGTTGSRPAVAILNAAMGVRRERYEAFARYLAGQGWIVVTYDYRGIGGSRHGSLPESGARLQDWGAKDLSGVIEWIYQRWRPRRCVAIGHSIGGQILGLAPNRDRLHAALLIASQKGYTRYWDGIWKWIVRAFWHAVPLLVKWFGRLPMAVAGCEDLPPQVALDWQRWALHPDFVDEQGQSLQASFARFTAPILSISFSDDPLYAPVRAVQALLRLYPNAPSQHLYVDPRDEGVKQIGHSGFFDRGICPKLWETARHWLETDRPDVDRQPSSPRIPGRCGRPFTSIWSTRTLHSARKRMRSFRAAASAS